MTSCAAADDRLLAAELAEAAGELLVRLRTSHAGDLGLHPLGDQASHAYLVDELGRRRPRDAVVSEEGVERAERLGSDRVWIVDPLGGTREFSEPGRTDWAVHVALVVGGVLTAGAVALPPLGVTRSTAAPPALPVLADRAPRIVVSRTRPTEWVRRLAERLGGELVSMGSAAAKAMAVVDGAADIYARAGGQFEWDPAAVAVASTAGLWTSRLGGGPLRYGRATPWLPDLLICRAGLRAEVLAIAASEGGPWAVGDPPDGWDEPVG